MRKAHCILLKKSRELKSANIKGRPDLVLNCITTTKFTKEKDQKENKLQLVGDLARKAEKMTI